MTNILSDAQADNITWGMSGAPLVTQDLVIVNPGGKKEKGLIAYDRNTGEIKWTGGSSQAGYSSPVLMQLCGIEQVVIFDAQGVAGHDLANGRQLWRFTFETFEGINVCQPILVPEDRVFVSAGYNSGAVLLQITFNGKEWMAEPVWKNKNMKCKMGSCILHDGHIYGLDDAIFACLNAETGKRNWKGGRYGHGQFLLRGDCLVIQAENGDLVLCAPDPREHRELAKLPMLPGGKTWNPPALAGNLLLLRNHFEAVLLQLPIRDASSIESSPAN